MNRRSLLKAAPTIFLSPYWLSLESRAESLPEVPALPAPHFPSRLHQFIWRNWELANSERMAHVIGATAAQVEEIGGSMGLPPKRAVTDEQLRRSYITIIRQNWHVLPNSQIIELLGWNDSRYQFTLKEDDFLDIKLGMVKPACEPLRYSPPTAAQREHAHRIRQLLHAWFGAQLKNPGEDRFAFVEEFNQPPSSSLRNPSRHGQGQEIELNNDWILDTHGESSAVQPAAEQLRWFLSQRMGTQLSRNAGSDKRLLLKIEPGPGAKDGSFRIECTPSAVVASAANETGLLQAVNYLQDEMERREGPFLEQGAVSQREVWSPRYLYSYFALYGDPLMEGDAAGLPDWFLERLVSRGINGVWIQAVLNTLAPSKAFPEFGSGWQIRLKNLRALTERAAKRGIKIYLYLNEPRAMPAAFFAKRPEIRGSKYLNLYSMCTSTPIVRDWIRETLSLVFREAPALGGVFSITMSENHTNCFSQGGTWDDTYPVATGCPRCSRRKPEDVLAELIQTFCDGARAQSETAQIISWDWGWGAPLTEKLIPKLPKKTGLMSVSEWDQPVFRGGVHTAVHEYSMSVVGPGPRALKNWQMASRNGLQALAKTQFNNTWEISAVPYIPVLPLVLEHCERLSNAGVNGLMCSWTCGGYPSPNLRASAAYAYEPRPAKKEILAAEAERVYGKDAASDAVAAWQRFSDAFLEFPYGVAVYILPTQHGPANLLQLKPTGLKPGMILFPYDAYRAWSGAYPPEVVQSQMTILASKWLEGIPLLKRAANHAPPQKKKEAERELAIALTCQRHFQSTANQVEFYLLRDKAASQTSDESRPHLERMMQIARDELEISKEQYFVDRANSVIAYEASNHYYYTPLDLAEKMLNCDYIERELKSRLATTSSQKKV